MTTILTFSKYLTAILMSVLIGTAAHAQRTPEVETEKAFGDYRVIFTAFNSSFISPEVAAEHDITRSRNRGLVNISLIEGDSITGRKAIVEGTVTDLMSRQRTLDFFEVREGDAVYYLAQFSISNQDPLTFEVNVRAEPDGTVMPVTFRRTFYRD